MLENWGTYRDVFFQNGNNNPTDLGAQMFFKYDSTK